MDDTYWDPANLLQITFNSSPNGEIQCIGQTWRNNGARCRWDVPDPAAIRDRLARISRKRPESLTLEDMQDLASRCLCAKYHAGQLADTLARWRPIIGRALREQKRLAGAATTNDEALQLRIRLLESAKEVSRLEVELATLRDQLASAKSESSQNQRQLRHALTEIDEKNRANILMRTMWQESVDKEERCKSELVSVTSGLTAQLKKAEEQAGVSRRELEKAQGDRKTMEAGLAEVEERLGQEEGLHKEMASRLKEEETRHKETTGRLAAELVVLRQAQTDLEATHQLNKLLEDKMQRLEASHASLKTSIDACWLHRLWAWVSCFTILPGLLRSRWQPLNKQENVLEV